MSILTANIPYHNESQVNARSTSRKRLGVSGRVVSMCRNRRLASVPNQLERVCHSFISWRASLCLNIVVLYSPSTVVAADRA